MIEHMIDRFRFFRIAAAAVGAAAVIAVPLAASADEEEELEAVREQVSGMFEVIEPGDVNAGPIDGWYTIQRGSIIAYISADGRYLMQGDLIDLDAGVNLTDLSRDEARRELFADVADSQFITFTPDDVKHSIVVFTDIGCAYCRRLHAQIDEYLANGIEVRYLLYPRNGPASREWKTSEEVWCASDRQSALTAAKLDRDFKTSECDASAVQDHYVLGRDVGLSGTPAIVLEDGRLIGGYMPPDALAAELAGNEPQARNR